MALVRGHRGGDDHVPAARRHGRGRVVLQVRRAASAQPAVLSRYAGRYVSRYVRRGAHVGLKWSTAVQYGSAPAANDRPACAKAHPQRPRQPVALDTPGRILIPRVKKTAEGARLVEFVGEDQVERRRV